MFVQGSTENQFYWVDSLFKITITKCSVHSSLDWYYLIEQSLYSEMWNTLIEHSLIVIF